MEVNRRIFGLGLTAIAFSGLARHAYGQIPPASKLKCMAMARSSAIPTI
jgi:hypothetical protein